MDRKMSFFYKAYKEFSVDTITHKYLSEHIDEFIQLDEKDIIRLQECLLLMLKDIDSMCRKYNIEYSLIGGNILGKIRHNGFIPWDDDIDLIMMRQDYEKFKEAFYESELTDNYLLRAPGCRDGADFRCMKIYKKNSIMELAFHKNNVQKKIFIDVMPVDYVPDNRIHRRIKDLKISLLTSALGSVDFKCNFSPELKREMKKTNIGRLNYALRAFFGTILGVIPIQKWYVWYDKAPQFNRKTNYVTIFNGKLLYINEIMPIESYWPFHDIEFCGVKTKMIQKPLDYLVMRYGKDYMTPPTPENRETHIVKRIDLDTK